MIKISAGSPADHVEIGFAHRRCRQRVAWKNRATHAAKEHRLRVRDDSARRRTTRFSVKFYLVAMLFILFDLEIVFMYPWRSFTKKRSRTAA